MTLAEKVAADAASSQLKAVGGFSNAFRSATREAIKEGEILTIPEDYVVYENRNLGDEKRGYPQYINCPTNMGRTVELYPSMLTRTAFVVDDNCKPVLEGTRQKRVPTGGTVAKYVAGKAIDPTMQSMKGCQIQFHNSKEYNTREFGVSADVATKDNVVPITVGDWDFVGEKKPEGYVAEA